MALSWDSVQKAWHILHAINPEAKNSFIAEHDPDEPLRENTIIGSGRKADDGWENIFMNVRNITREQIEIFERRKKEVPNTSFLNYEDNGITCIGWI